MINSIDSKTLKQWLTNKEVFLIDVREKNEFDEQSIDGSYLIPLSTISLDKILEKNIDNKKIVIHCRLGVRSITACQKLIKENPDLELWNLEGGITSWIVMNKN